MHENVLDNNNLPLSMLKVFKKTLSSGFNFIILPIVIFIVHRFIVNIDDAADPTIINNLINILYLVDFLALLIVFLYQYYYYRVYNYVFGNRNAEVSKGVLSRSTGYVDYNKIQNVYVDQDIVDKILGLYDVHYETAGEKSGNYSHIDGLNKNNSAILVEFLNNKVNGPTRKIEEKSIAKTEVAEKGKAVLSSKYIYVYVLKIFLFSIFLSLLASFIIYDVYQSGLVSGNFYDYQWLKLLVVLLIVFNIIICAYRLIWIKNFTIEFDEKSFRIKTQVLSSSVSIVYYNRIQNLVVDREWEDIVFGLYNLKIETAGEQSSKHLLIPGLSEDDALKLKNFFQKQIEKNK